MSDPLDFPDRLCHKETGYTVVELFDAIIDASHGLINEMRRARTSLNYSEAGLRARGYDKSEADAEVAAQEAELVAEFNRLLNRAQTYLPKQ